MKPSFTDLPIEIQHTFGNGCSFVPDFIFTASCQQHDFNFARGGGIADWVKANYDMATHMWADSSLWWHYIVTVVYFTGLMFGSWPFFYFESFWKGNYNSLDKILEIDRLNKRWEKPIRKQ